MPNRQQRAARNQRVAGRAQPPLVPLLAAYFANPIAGGVRVTLAIAGEPFTGEGYPGDFFLVGLPRVYAIGADQYCSAAVKTTIGADSFLDLTYDAGELPEGEALFFTLYDPAIRTAQGGFVAPSKVTVTP